MAVKITFTVSNFDQYLAVECAMNVENIKHIMYPNHSGNGYIQLPVISIDLEVDGNAIYSDNRKGN